MNLCEITSLLLRSVSTANTIDNLDCAQHLFGFRTCIESVCLEISAFTTTDGVISDEGVWAIENLCDRTLDTLSRDEEGLVPFIDGIKDATICIHKIAQDYKEEHDTNSI